MQTNNAEVDEKMSDCFKKMSLSFVDSVKAEECFRKLHQMKDNNIFRALLELLCQQNSSNVLQNQVMPFSLTKCYPIDFWKIKFVYFFQVQTFNLRNGLFI